MKYVICCYLSDDTIWYIDTKDGRGMSTGRYYLFSKVEIDSVLCMLDKLSKGVVERYEIARESDFLQENDPAEDVV